MGGVKVPTAYVQCFRPSLPHSASSPQTLVPSVSSPSLKRRSISDGAVVMRSALFGTKLYRFRSGDHPDCSRRTVRRATSAGIDSFSNEKNFPKKIEETATTFRISGDNDDKANRTTQSETADSSKFNSSIEFAQNWGRIDPVEPPDWPASIEWKANSLNIPISLRIIKRRKQWQGFRETGETACCSVEKAFSSMVFIIRELHSFTLQMREALLFEDLRGILARVQNEMHASFVWLFQQVFSHTPTLMVYVMILLANYSVYSMSNNAIAAQVPPQSYAATTVSVSVYEEYNHKLQKFDSTRQTFSITSSNGKTTSIGGNDGGGGKFRRAPGNTDGDGSESLNHHRTILPDGVSSVGTSEEESVSGNVMIEDELGLWHSMVEEATRMQGDLRGESLDHETMQRFVSPVTAEIEADEYEDYVRTELLYEKGLAQDPNNPLLLANYAQFLYLVAQDYNRAEEYFKRAVKVDPPDAESLSKYAIFLWQARKDLWAAEEAYLEAITVDAGNSHYAANYAHFLWSTGGEDTCFPLDNSHHH